MKKAPPVRLSLRKLFIAMLAVGPVAILPSPLLAAIPSTLTTNRDATGAGVIIQTNGTGSLSTGPNLATITVSDRSVLVWTNGSFNIAAGERYRFEVPGGSVLNRVGYSAAVGGGLAASDTAIINGTLDSNGRVFVLANGNITVGGSAVISSTGGGVFLSTLQETSDSQFMNSGSLAFNGTNTGNITLGNATGPGARVNLGNLTAWGNVNVTDNLTVAGDLILNASLANQQLSLTGSTVGGSTSVAGNLTVTTNNGTITQGTAPLTVAGGTTSLRTNGNAPIALANTANDFNTVTLNTGGAVTLGDANNIALGTSTVGGALNVSAVNSITTTGAVAVAGSATLTSTSVGDIVFANGSSVGGTFNATTGTGNITVNTIGNLLTGDIRTGSSSSALTITGTFPSGTGYTTAPTVTFVGGLAPGGVGATATATVDTTTGRVTGVSIVSAGTGYTSAPTITFLGGGARPVQAATATVSIGTLATSSTITVTQGGGGYDPLNPPTITFSAPAGATPPVVDTVTITDGQITAITLSSPGTGYTSAPTITIPPSGQPGTVVAAATIGVVGNPLPASITPPTTGTLSGGTGYTTAPTVSIIVGTTLGSGATATAAVNTTTGVVSGVTFPQVGTGFTSAPTLTFIGGGSLPTTVATATPALSLVGSGNVSLTTAGMVTIGGVISPVTNVSVLATSIAATPAGAIGNNTGAAGAVTLNATSGSIQLPSINASSVVATAPAGSITQLGTITTAEGSTSIFNAGPAGNITLTNANAFGSPTTGLSVGSVNLTGGTVSLSSTQALTLGETIISGSLNINTVSAPTGTGNVILGAGFGTAAVGIRVAGALTIATNNASVSDDNYAPWDVLGAVTINTNPANLTTAGAGADVLLTAAGAGFGNPRTSFGQVNINAGRGTANVIETTTLNLGTISAGLVQANSTQGDIVQSGAITSLGLSDQNRFAVSNNTTTSIVLDNPANSFTTNGIFGGVIPGSSPAATYTVAQSENNNGDIVIVGGNNNVIHATGNIRTDNRTNVSGGNLTINATGNVILGGGNYRDLVVNAGDSVQISARQGQGGQNSNRVTITAGSSNATSIFQGGNTATGNINFVNNGTLTLTTPGGVQLVSPNNNLNIVNLNGVAGDAYIYSRTDLTITGTNAANVTVAAGTRNTTATEIGGRYNVVLRDVNFGNLTAYALNGLTDATGLGTFATPLTIAGLGGNIIQQNATTTVAVGNRVNLISYGGDITLTNNNNNFGRVDAQSIVGSSPLPSTSTVLSGSGNISIREYDTLRVGNIRTNGTVNLTSRFGSIIDDSANLGTTLTVGGPLNLVASNGSIMLGNATGNISGANLTASGSANISSTGDLVLGSIAANSLTVSGNSIAQSSPLSIFGQASFTSTGAQGAGIVLNDPANNFGPIVINAAANSNVSIVEGATLNLRTVTMPAFGNGTFTVNSVNGDIIDTGLGFVHLGGSTLGAGTGVVTLTAANGNIIIDDPTSDIRTDTGIVFNANNVTLSVLGNSASTILLGSPNATSAAAGNLTVSTILGSIGNNGTFTVGGDAFFQAPNGRITIGQNPLAAVVPGVGFGRLRFIGQQVTVIEQGSMDILTGSAAFGPANLTSTTGSISIVGVPGTEPVTFASTVALTAAGNIVLPKLVRAAGQLSVRHTGTADLSALNISSDLGNIAPIDLGTGTYLPPSQ